jgi:hypothetical protein
MREITNFNPETKSYQWLLFLISSIFSASWATSPHSFILSLSTNLIYCFGSNLSIIDKAFLIGFIFFISLFLL